jgi:transposase InsO family protein
MGQSLKKYIRNCRQCVLGKSHTGRRAGLWQRGERPSSALDVWHIDHAGPLVKSHGYTQLLVVIDGFSKYCSLRPIRKKSTEDTIRALSLVFEQMGKPRRIIADRAAAFTSLTFQNFLADQEVQLHHIATGMPRGNGQVERLMRTVFNLLRASFTAENEKNWVHEISVMEPQGIHRMLCTSLLTQD